MKLLDKVSIVSGSSTGIGQAIALALAREGAKVVVNYRSDEDGANTTVDAISRLGREAFAFKADLRSVSDIESLVEATIARFGRIDTVINNAAIPGWKPLFEVAEEDWDGVIDTNLKGTFFLSLRAARYMKDSGGGSIVNLSSSCGGLAVPHLAAYTASKGGIAALTMQMALDLAPYKIRVNAFAPGPTIVPRNLRDDPDYDEKWSKVVPLGRAGLAEEMGPPAVFLASDDSSFITGQLFYVDGGLTIASRAPSLDFVSGGS